MARLMQTVEDTTALRRCGPAGLAQLRRDGVRLEELVVAERDPIPFLITANDDYRRQRLTMGEWPIDGHVRGLELVCRPVGRSARACRWPIIIPPAVILGLCVNGGIVTLTEVANSSQHKIFNKRP